MQEFLKRFGGFSFDFNDWEVHWAPTDWTGILIVFGLLVPLALRFCWTSLNRIHSTPKKLLLLGTRFLVFALLLLVVLQPELELQKSKLLKNHLAVLVDDSRSLSIQTFPQDTPRSRLALDAIDRNEKFFESLEETYQVDFYFVSDALQNVSRKSLVQRYRANGLRTDFHQVLKEVGKEYEGKSLQGLLLFSDGADLLQEEGEISEALTEQLVNLKAPLHTLQTGSNENFKDLGIAKVDRPEFGFVHQPVTLEVTLVASGMGTKKVPVVLKENNKILVSRMVEINDKTSRYTASLEFTPRTTGRHVYSLTVPLYSGESIASNNRLDFQVKVVRDRIRVLHLNGRPSWDSRFLREVLINNPKVDLLSFFILRTTSDNVDATTRELSLIPFPSNLLFSDYLNSFDLVIFHNFKFEPFIDKKYLVNIKKYVREGGAFVMVGGDLAFQSGGYMNTAIDDILPVRMRNASKKFMDEEIPFEFDPKFSNHPILRLEKDPESNLKVWKDLPKLNGLNIGLKPRKGAQVLAGQGEHPILLVQNVDKGRTLALASDTTWNWNFRRVGQGGSGRYYQKFWNNVIAWTTGAPETHLIQVESDKEKYRLGEKVIVKFTVYQDDYQPDPNKKVRLRLKAFTQNRMLEDTELTTDESGQGTFEFLPENEGFYKVTLDTEKGGGVLTNETGFSVMSPTAEFQKPRINDFLLGKMAELTGGKHKQIGKDPDLGDLEFPNPEVSVKTRSLSITLWDNWWSYGLIVFLLFADWWVRRKSGLS